ncbi:MAG: alpha/beta fold hydrolase [Acidimicrobiia bacterium]
MSLAGGVARQTRRLETELLTYPPVVRALSGYVDVLGRNELLARGTRLLIDAGGALAHAQERQLRWAAHAVGATTRTERRVQREREARAKLRAEAGAEPLPAGREPAVHWHEGGSGRLVVLLNGWTASGLLWPGALLGALEERFRVVRVDNRGSGWSRSAPSPYSIPRMADDVAEVLEVVDGGPATVVGLSMGGMIAQELALRHPRLVERLVLVGTRPPAPAHIPSPPEVFAGMLEPPEPGQALREYLRESWRPQFAAEFLAEHPEVLDEVVDRVVARPTPRRAVLEQLRAVSTWTGPDRLSSIAVPTTIVHGDRDRLMPVGNGIRLARLIPGARYAEYAGVGHLVPFEAPAVLAEVVREAAGGRRRRR